MRIAFLIEGCRSSSNRFKEVVSAKKLAEANGAKSFDVIESYSARHLAATLKFLPREQWKLLAFYCIVCFKEEISNQEVIDKIVKPGFKQLITDGVIKNIPSWLSNLTNQFSINIFIKTQHDEHFSDSPDGFKDFSKKLHNTMLKISDDLSSSNLLSYLTKNPDITHVYALIGKHHINFIDHLSGVEIVESKENICKLQLTLDSRIIHLELHGNEHGKMDHFYTMQHSCKRAGLVIPEVPEAESPAKIDALMIQRLTTSISSNHSAPKPNNTRKRCTSRLFEAAIVKNENAPQVNGRTANALFDLEKAAAAFDYWMKTYDRPKGQSHGEWLVRWIYCDCGAAMLSNYEEFCRLAKELNTMEYNIPTPPAQSKFDQAITKYNSRYESESDSSEDIPQVNGRPANALFDLEKAATKFDYWMTEYDHSRDRQSHGEKLVSWLYCGRGAAMLSNYEEFCRLAKELNTTEYNIPTPPTKSEFGQAITTYNRETGHHDGYESDSGNCAMM